MNQILKKAGSPYQADASGNLVIREIKVRDAKFGDKLEPGRVTTRLSSAVTASTLCTQNSSPEAAARSTQNRSVAPRKTGAQTACASARKEGGAKTARAPFESQIGKRSGPCSIGKLRSIRFCRSD